MRSNNFNSLKKGLSAIIFWDKVSRTFVAYQAGIRFELRDNEDFFLFKNVTFFVQREARAQILKNVQDGLDLNKVRFPHAYAVGMPSSCFESFVMRNFPNEDFKTINYHPKESDSFLVNGKEIYFSTFFLFKDGCPMVSI